MMFPSAVCSFLVISKPIINADNVKIPVISVTIVIDKGSETGFIFVHQSGLRCVLNEVLF